VRLLRKLVALPLCGIAVLIIGYAPNPAVANTPAQKTMQAPTTIKNQKPLLLMIASFEWLVIGYARRLSGCQNVFHLLR
jgi:hypothetical protein